MRNEYKDNYFFIKSRVVQFMLFLNSFLDLKLFEYYIRTCNELLGESYQHN